MKILAIELKNYKRLKLNEFSQIHIDIHSPIQQILGGNGAGKSSVLSELNPLAANHRDFDKGGYKHIWISHRGSQYECISDFESGNKHTFIKDGVILNDAGNAKVQNDLVFEHFHYTKELKELTLGRIKFTRMSVTERKKWLNELSVNDYSFANSAYQFFKERLRDINGSIKENKRRLVFEENKQLSKEEIQRLEEETSTLHKELTELLEARDNPQVGVSELLKSYETKHNQVISLCKDILLLDANNSIGVESKESLLELIDHLELKVNQLQTLLSEKQRSYTKVHDEYLILKQAGDNDATKLRGNIQALCEEIEKFVSKKRLPAIQVENATQSYQILNSIELELSNLVLEVVEDPKHELNQKTLSALRDTLSATIDKRRKSESILNALQARRAHLEEHKEKGHVKCPNCAHEWIMDYDERTYQRTLTEIDKEVSQIRECTVIEKTLQERIDALLEYGLKARQYFTLINSTPILKPFWDLLREEDLFKLSPKSIPSWILKFKEDLMCEVKIEEYTNQIKDYEKLLTLTSHIENKNIDSLLLKMKEADSEIGLYTEELKKTKAFLLKVNRYQAEIQFIQNKSDQLETILSELPKLGDALIRAKKFEVINALIREKQSVLAVKEEILSTINNYQQRILFLNEELEKASIDANALELLVREISPTEGLIAEGLGHFINTLVERMNHEIQKIWSYPLKVQGCSYLEDSSIDLDYKFPLLITDSRNIVSDVSEGSEGMQEIINVAFVLVAMYFLDLKDYPIFLDEFGASFDETHRKKAVYLIKSLVDNLNFSQLFIVSHYYSMHGSIQNSEVCVLNKDNISVIGDYNRHVRFL